MGRSLLSKRSTSLGSNPVLSASFLLHEGIVAQNDSRTVPGQGTGRARVRQLRERRVDVTVEKAPVAVPLPRCLLFRIGEGGLLVIVRVLARLAKPPLPSQRFARGDREADRDAGNHREPERRDEPHRAK
ncbi:hypothetical protein [Sorangium sp. So ce145]|uniref:hypothetical protein n=1 Tax=Sorangium sp. So ce145 TaxID=3133285 RepID=UPI003F6139F4